MKLHPEPSTQEVLAGLVERVTYHNVENGFCVLRAEVRGHRDVVTVVGHAAAIAAGEWITASGDWVNDRTHGQQFKARFLRTSPPTSAEGIEKYLSSGMIRGVGPVYAKKLVRAFGEKVFDVIELTPERLREVDGIGPVRAASILAAWAEQKAVREIMVFLHSHGIGTARAVRIFKTYGSDAIQVMTENPYRLARDIRGIGFKTADAIAMKLGIEKTAMVRVRAGVSYALTEAMDEGHCGLPTDELVPLAEKLLEVPGKLVRTALDLELTEGVVIEDRVGETRCVFLAGLYRAERTIAERLMRLANGPLPWPWINPDKALPWVEERIGLALAESQVAAIRLALMSKVLVMTGGPGVGKTTIIRGVLRILAAKGTDLLLCAPTGRAAKRMTEATGFEAKTIHRLLEVDPKGGGFKRGADNPLDCDLLVVDETSMVDVLMMQALMKAVPDKAALLIVGDIDQLPSVGPGQVLADVIASGAVPVVRLTEVFRQAAQSRIITSAHRINRGSMPDLSPPGAESDFYFVQADDPETTVPRCSGTFSTPGSRGVRSWSCWSGRRRLSPSPSEMSRVDDGGRSCRSGCVPARPPRSTPAWRVEPGWQWFLQHPRVRQWLGRTERAWTLLSFDSLLALRQEPSAGRGRNGLRHGCLDDRGRRLGDMASRIEGFTFSPRPTPASS